MRRRALAIALLCLAAGPATQPTTKPALAPETREREGTITVDAVKGGNFRLKIVKGDVYTFKVSGEWQSISGKPWGPEGRDGGTNFKFEGKHFRENGSPSGDVAIGAERRWTVPNSGYLLFPGLENPSSKTDRRSGQMIVKFKRVTTSKEDK